MNAFKNVQVEVFVQKKKRCKALLTVNVDRPTTQNPDNLVAQEILLVRIRFSLFCNEVLLFLFRFFEEVQYLVVISSCNAIKESRMEDDLEEKVLKQACASQMKILSKFAVGFFNRPGPGNSSITHFLRILLRPEVFLIAIVIFVFCFYLQAIELNANGFLNRISNSLKSKTTKPKISFTSSLAEKDSWDEIKTQSAVYAVQGRRPRMEDR